ncbi:D-hexose-6-phosphate mutarotase [Thiocapsa imhoffii]|uniref:Putative glucose-6-phosphate 1-epimerase n=1 Tax=Thiocapsa imhoffii TaxID=382777 RepID=A0A9X0WFW7_9GAMM|nr:D-hexose-6-phosphate mutarotase [Thiocapsa imhoffii]MBK1643750.1 D-hexose-6-phosphate mutarotase [Thiocapsa imhoffii]
MDIEALNAQFGIENVLRVVTGRGGLTMIEITNGLATALISPHGGQVLSFRPAHAAEDLFFVSERAYFEAGQAIKGGVPVCWPWFGPDPQGQGRPAHGFARIWPWTILATAQEPDGSTFVQLGIADDEHTRALWPYYFNLLIEIRVGTTLAIDLITRNAGDRPLRLTQGLHAYFKVGDAGEVAVHGLSGCRYLDKAADGADAVIEQTGPVRFDREVNRIYEAVPAELSIEDPVLKRRIGIETKQSRTAVVWNPWVETARAMPDLDDADYRHFVCVETVNTASEVIEIPPAQDYSLGARYRIESA